MLDLLQVGYRRAFHALICASYGLWYLLQQDCSCLPHLGAEATRCLQHAPCKLHHMVLNPSRCQTNGNDIHYAVGLTLHVHLKML
jgi:hypothetical protein